MQDPASTPGELALIAAGADDPLVELAAVRRLLAWYYGAPAPEARTAG